ncbi:MAG: dephospho-CoA kinase [Myxococcota bacterium]
MRRGDLTLFGLTGGVASGKSTVSAHYRERGLAVIDADLVARAVVEPGTEGLAELVQAFGADILDDAGRLDRPRLGQRVFRDEEARRVLERALHPRITEETRRRASALDAQGVTLAAYDAALLVERGLADAFRPLVVVAASAATQKRRLMKRDALADEPAQARIDAQWPVEDKRAVADHVIENEGTRSELLARADVVLDAICAELGLPRITPECRG